MESPIIGGGAPWRRQGSQSGLNSPTTGIVTSPAPPPSSNRTLTMATGTPTPPPPPPMVPSGSLPPVRLNSEVGGFNKGPPKQIQGAMMKEKKPFTYTPGGIDLSEIRGVSPRMAKRIQMNAASEGVSCIPQPNYGNGTPGPTFVSTSPPTSLPPAALAAMQPQLPVAVFPQGGIPNNTQRNIKPSHVMSQEPLTKTNISSPQGIPMSPAPKRIQESFQGLSPPVDLSRPKSPAGMITGTTPPMSLASFMNQSLRFGPPPQDDDNDTETETQVQSLHNQQKADIGSKPLEQPLKTKAQALSQQIGSIYNPPTPPSASFHSEQRPSTCTIEDGTTRSQPPHQMTILTNVSSTKKTPTSVGSIDSFGSDRDKDTSNNIQPISQSKSSSASNSPLVIPQLNKAPTPWLNSFNRLAQQHSTTTPPYVIPSSVNQSPDTISSPQGFLPSSSGRSIPINFINTSTDGTINNVQSHVQSPTNGKPFISTSQIQIGGNRNPSYSSQSPIGGISSTGARIIPIHIQRQNSDECYQKQQYPNYDQQSSWASPKILQRDATNEGAARMSTSQDEGYRTVPIQSKSFKLIQKITDDEENEHEHLKLDLKGEDKQLMDAVKAKVDDTASLHQQNTEPRFRGGHIPSRAFQTLRSHLPPTSPASADFKEDGSTLLTKPGPVTHNIQISYAPESGGGHTVETGGQVKQSLYNPSSPQYLDSSRRNQAGARCVRVIPFTAPSDDRPGPALEGSSPAPAGIMKMSSSPCPSPCSSNSPDSLPNNENDGGSIEESYGGTGSNGDINWDAYWYYYWYWANYWNSQGYEIPTETEEEGEVDSAVSVPVPSKTFRTLQKAFAQDTPQTLIDDTSLDPSKDISFSNDVNETRSDDTRKHSSEMSASVIENEANAKVSESITVDTSITPTEISMPSPVIKIEEQLVEDPPSFVFYSPKLRSDQLSTIDEVSEPESFSPHLSYTSSVSTYDEDETETDDDSSSTSSEEVGSSTSVIRNTSTEGYGATTTTASINDDTDESSDEEIEVESTVTVRLPLKLSFTKSKSYRDIATVFVGSTELNVTGLDEGQSQKSIKVMPTAQPELRSSEEKVISEKISKDVDFWKEINDVPPESGTTTFQDISKDSRIEEINFWDKPKSNLTSLHYLKTRRDFELIIDEDQEPDIHTSRRHPEIRPASEDSTDESSSKSSSATVTGTPRQNTPSDNLIFQGSRAEEITTTQAHNLNTFEGDEEDPKSYSCPTVHPVAKAENLLWRIERFLQQSFTSMGSEEDSGVMTDHSRLSDGEESDTEDGQPGDEESKDPLSSSSTSEEESGSSLKKSLNYQRAKTHSRLFELLQEECEKEDEEPEVIQPKSKKQNRNRPKSLQLPKTESGLLSIESGGSLSGSSGVLSPVNRDQILADLISQFQSRQNQRRSSSVGPSTVGNTCGTAFPSKIFKMLHDEFGEEFYDAFDFGPLTASEESPACNPQPNEDSIIASTSDYHHPHGSDQQNSLNVKENSQPPCQSQRIPLT